MNIFLLSLDIQKCAEFHCDKHLVKMILETAMLLCTTLQLLGQPAPYRAVFPKHPCNKWLLESLSNWRFIRELGRALNTEYRFRYDKNQDHKAYTIMEQLEEPNLEDKGLTRFALAMPDKYKEEDAILSYRKYYSAEKYRFATWKKRNVPAWFLPLRKQLLDEEIIEEEEEPVKKRKLK